MEAIEDDICIRFVNVTDDHKKIEKLRASLVTGSNNDIIIYAIVFVSFALQRVPVAGIFWIEIRLLVQSRKYYPFTAF